MSTWIFELPNREGQLIHRKTFKGKRLEVNCGTKTYIGVNGVCLIYWDNESHMDESLLITLTGLLVYFDWSEHSMEIMTKPSYTESKDWKKRK